MARSRNIKPGFFKNEILPDIDYQGRLLFIGLWTLADREGRLEYRPRRIKGELFPYEDCNVEKYILDLEGLDFIILYEVDKTQYIQILNFEKHQNPHKNEKASTIPAPYKHGTTPVNDESAHADSFNLIPDSLQEDSGATAPTPEGKKKKTDSSCTMKTFLENCKQDGEKAIPEDDPVFRYAQDADLSVDFVWLAWREFVARHINRDKKYKGKRGWRQAFGNCVRGNWYELWAVGDTGYFMTKQGKQAQIAHKEAAHD